MKCEPVTSGDYCICRHCQRRMTPREERACTRGPYDGCDQPLPTGETGGVAGLTCRHRGPAIAQRVQKIEQKGCGECGRRGERIAVFACGIHGRCTLRPWQARQTEAVCRDCAQRAAE